MLDKYAQPQFQMEAGSIPIKNISVIPSSWHYFLIIAFIWTTLVAFLLAFLLMIIRCLFVVDFELIKITIASQEQMDDQRVLHGEGDNQT